MTMYIATHEDFHQKIYIFQPPIASENSNGNFKSIASIETKIALRAATSNHEARASLIVYNFHM